MKENDTYEKHRDRPRHRLAGPHRPAQGAAHTLHLDGDTKLEIFVDGDAIVLKKHRPAGSCDFCGDVDANAIQFAGYCICPACRRKIGAL